MLLDRLENAIDEILLYGNDENQTVAASVLEQLMSEIKFADAKGFLKEVSIEKMSRVVKVLEQQVRNGDQLSSADNFPENLIDQGRFKYDVAMLCTKAGLEIMTATSLPKDVAVEEVIIIFIIVLIMLISLFFFVRLYK